MAEEKQATTDPTATDITPSVNFDCSQLRIFLSPNKPRLVKMDTRGN
jgi:hypothetical protein